MVGEEVEVFYCALVFGAIIAAKLVKKFVMPVKVGPAICNL